MVSVARLVTTAAVAGGLLVGSVALGEGVASAAPAPSKVVPASCGQTVSAQQGDTVRVKPKYGATEDYTVGGAGTTRIPSTLERPDCEVDVQMRAPAVAPAPAPMAAYPIAPAPMAAAPAAAPGVAAAPAVPVPAPAAAPVPAARAAVPAPVAPVPAPARSATSPAARGTGVAASSAAGGLAPAPALPAVPSLPLGAPVAPAAPMAPAPPAAPDAQVLPTRNTADLSPADDSHGLGVPILIALIAGTGVAAFVVRMVMLRRRSAPAHAAPRHDDPFASGPLMDPAEETAFVEPAEARTVVGARV